MNFSNKLAIVAAAAVTPTITLAHHGLGGRYDQDSTLELEGEIAHYKIPKYVRFVAEFPMTVTGKVQKFEMRRILAEELGVNEQQTA